MDKAGNAAPVSLKENGPINKRPGVFIRDSMNPRSSNI